MRSFFWVAVVFALAGCAAATKQTDEFLASKHDLPSRVQIENVPFINQSVGHCGPATLAMAMQWAGRSVTADELAAQAYTPGMKGSLQSDLIGASRRQGMFAVQIQGLSALMTEVSAGHPVLVFENLALTWAPQYHYALVFGYDLPKEEVILHSGPEAGKRWDLRKFERSWRLGDYWGLVVLNPGQLSTAGSESANLTAAAGLEQVGRLEDAEKSYDAILQRWPKSLGALIGQGNVNFQKKKFREALVFLKRAAETHPESAMAWHNLAIAQGRAGSKKEAAQSAQKALRLVSAESRPAYAENLKNFLLSPASPKTH